MRMNYIKKLSQIKKNTNKIIRIKHERLKKSQGVKLKIICNMIDYL